MEWIANVEMEELEVPLKNTMFHPRHEGKGVPQPFHDTPQWQWKCPICGKIPFSDHLVLDSGKIEVNSLPERFTEEVAHAIQEVSQEEPIVLYPEEEEAKDFVCEFCGKAYAKKKSLTAHRNLFHSDEMKLLKDDEVTVI